MPRTIKLGRKPVVWPVASHWAIKVGGTWYEIEKSSQKDEHGHRNLVIRSCSDQAASSAGSLGGEIVGETTKSDDEIYAFINRWLSRHPYYDALAHNCQMFAYELVVFLTDGGNFRLPHSFDSAVTPPGLANSRQPDAFAVVEDGIAIAHAGTGEIRDSIGPVGAMYRGPSCELAAVAGPGLGAWVGASPLGRAELNWGPVAGVHVEPNLNTGVGVRDGNLDVHLFGFGGRFGADGLEVNTPLGGVKACTIS
jgi:hypothetical protein